MSNKICCCLCYAPCDDFKFIHSENGESNGVYDITVKYFDPMILTEDEESGQLLSPSKVLCSACWTHINDFHEFQVQVLKTRSLLRMQQQMENVSSSNAIQEMVVMPNENKDYYSEDDDMADGEYFDSDSMDDIPLKKLVKLEQSPLLDKENQKVTRTKKTSKNSKQIRYGDSKSKDKTDEYNSINSTLSGLESDIFQDELLNNNMAITNSLQPKQELGTDDELATTNDFIKTENVEDSDGSMEETPPDNSEKPKKRRGRPKNAANEEKKSSKKLLGTTRKKKENNLPKKPKDPKRTTYMEKCRENDKFIAKWKPTLDCDLCTDTVADFDALRAHFREVHKTKCYIKCCDRKFYRRYVLMDHIRLHIDPDTHKCDICGKSSTTKYNLKLHKQIVHGELNQFECDVCHRQFNQKPTLDRHLLTHVKGEKKFFCKECDRGYVLEVQLTSHIKSVHSNEVVCDQCGKTFHNSSTLRKHLNEHAGVPRRKYPCDICGVQLITNNGLRRHKSAYHHDGSTAYVCSVCGKVASSENALRSHKKHVHEEKRKYKCTYCDKAFKRPKVLREHIATHTGVDLYTCPHCPQTFKVSANMHHHRKRAHPVEWEEARRNRLQLPKVNITEVTNQVVL